MYERVTEQVLNQYSTKVVPVRVVVESVRARHDLGMYLEFSAQDLGVASLDMQLMPYVLALGKGTEQTIHPFAITQERFQDGMNMVKSGNSFVTNKDCIDAMYIRTLYEYMLECTSVLVDGTLQGMIVSPFAQFEGGREPEFELPVYFEPYGNPTYDIAKLFVTAPELIDPHELRRPLDESLQERIRAALESGEASIVTVGGPTEDVEGILKGQFVFEPGKAIVEKQGRNEFRINHGAWVPKK